MAKVGASGRSRRSSTSTTARFAASSNAGAYASAGREADETGQRCSGIGDIPLKTDGTKIRELRERKPLTLTGFAEMIGYALNSVHLIEVGKANGGPKFIRAAIRVLGCRIDDITTHGEEVS